jgi:hypothetical protein
LSELAISQRDAPIRSLPIRRRVGSDRSDRRLHLLAG